MLFLYAVTLGVSSFLVFFIQPMVGKAILPLYGGTPAIWNSCMLFFQIMLLAGYAYAHYSLRMIELRRQTAVHLVLLAGAFFLLPVTVGIDSVPPADINPPIFLLYKLLVAVGLPFFLVSSTGPLLQRWFMGTGHPASRDPYFLYAASNVGSLAALLGYPVLFEPGMGLDEQSSLWAWGYVLLFLLIAACTAALWRNFSRDVNGLAGGENPDLEDTAAPGWKKKLYWLFAAFVPSSFMLGATAHITTNVAVLPLFWVLPLALYLLTFILTFASEPPIPHRWMTRVFPLAAVPLGALIFLKIPGMEWLVVPFHLLLFFLAAMVCHGELVRARPPGRFLTGFYLWMAVGGMLGGLFNALLAPILFDRVVEYPLVLVLACLLLPRKSELQSERRWKDLAYPLGLAALTGVLLAGLEYFQLTGSRLGLGVLLLVLAAIAFCFYERPLRFALGLAILLLTVGYATEVQDGSTEYVTRNFFGVKRVVLDGRGEIRKLAHGATVHGGQFIDPEKGRHAITYYHRTGPAGDLFSALAAGSGPKKVAVVGLGVGLAAGYYRPGLHFTFYEVDQQVCDIAEDPRYFTYLARCGENCETVIGDGRLAIREAPDRSFDMILLDAFNSGTIPLHLLTVEAIETYRDKLRPGGFLAFHISNRFVALAPPLARIAVRLGLNCLIRRDLDRFYGKEPSVFLVMGRRGSRLDSFYRHPFWEEVPASDGALWTDQKSNLLSALKW